jgi:eukaryotic-like serine/threonine-protein kinase
VTGTAAQQSRASPLAHPDRLELIIESASGEERRFSIPPGRVHLGFGAEQRLIFSARPVSVPVCVLRGGADGWSVADCRERVVLQGAPVGRGPRPLATGDRLELARGLALRVGATPAQPATGVGPNGGLDAQLDLARKSSKRNLGRYLLLSELGSGAFSAVFRAWDTQANRAVALKSLVQLSHEVRLRFAREAVVARQLAHPHIVPVLDHGEHERRPYIVMELVEGRTLEQLCEEPLELKRAVKLLRDVADAIDHAHARNVLHRDLKPQNVVVDAKDHAWVLDFGLARFIREDGPRLTTTGAMLGTPLYLAPEQALGEGDARSDVYSLGALLYFALTGESPLDASSLDRYLDALMREAPEPPSARRAGVDATLDAIVLRCLQKDAALRYPSARDLVVDLDRWLSAGATFRPARAPLAVRARRWAKNNALAVRLGLVAVAFVVAAAVAVALIGR